ncbi:hypothetical protein GA0116948_11646 [Chitinophaga costaii]|uniref:Uncharacterized protein n=1 Tax=Chitinophaga costaii TaxID=1335309 RepID=A0A1C4FRL0_9BACT|nr:hypothetical protein [Chitinophaga costaii]PUZ20463.1 hypothetical protein DCM91_18690 [Chitinophaga costaii]SCC58225.1 hypothetical protein GA0116948_11646 [Chitinophaga costaii]
MESILQPGHDPEQPMTPQPQQPDIQPPIQPPAPQPLPMQPGLPNEVPDHDIKRTPSSPNDEDNALADEKLGPTQDYNPQGRLLKDRFPFPNIRY